MYSTIFRFLFFWDVTALQGNWFLTFCDNIVVSPSRIKMFNTSWNSSVLSQNTALNHYATKTQNLKYELIQEIH